MTETYSINRRTWKWTKKLFFHLFDLAILKTYILFSSLGSKKISLRDFRMTLMRNLVAQAGQERNVRRPVGGPAAPAAAIQSIWFEERGRQHRPIPSATRRWCRYVFSQGCHQKSYNDMPKVWCWAMLWQHMLSGLPQLGISLKHFRPFKCTSLLKIRASVGNVRKRNFKF